MNDDLTPDPLDAGDPFASSLGDRLHGAADGVDGAGVTQAGVAAAVTGRRRSVRTRAVAGGIAAAVVLLGAVAVAGPLSDDEPERIAAGGPTATEPCTRTASTSSGSVTTTTATTTTEVPTTEPAPSGGGQTPFEQWADVLREAGLLTVEQEAEIAAGRGISLTPEQSQVLQAHWDEQAGVPTTTVLAMPTPTPPAEPVEVPCDGDAGSGTTLPAGSPPDTTTTVAASDDPPVTTTSVAGSDDPPVTTTSVAGSDVAPPTTSTAPAPPS